MRKLLSFVFIVLVVSSVSPAHATLIDRGGGLIYDDVTNLTWLQDANYTGGKPNFFAALNLVANLTYYDSVRNRTWDDWRLPYTVYELHYMYHGNNITSSRPGPFINLQPGPYWYWDYENFTHTGIYSGQVDMSNGDYAIINGYENFSAWSVRNGDVGLAPPPQSASVPEPSSYLLLGAGLVLIMFKSKWVASKK